MINGITYSHNKEAIKVKAMKMNVAIDPGGTIGYFLIIQLDLILLQIRSLEVPAASCKGKLCNRIYSYNRELALPNAVLPQFSFA